ncbi:MAG: IS110 family transposase [Acidimicrobiaceae bacterium]|nr:IS110 family transposase [Acidimicrobiaceae bacterium]
MQDSGQDAAKVFVGVDVAKADHYACAVTSTGAEVLARAVPNDETAIRCLIDDAATHGAVVLVIDTTSSAASLLLETAAQQQIPVAYVTGLAMRAAAGLYAGAAKTDPKDALVLADYARRNADRLSWTQPSDELLAKLRILNSRDTDLAADATRTVNRLRDALLAVSPALERAIGNKLASSAGLRDALVSWATPTALKTAGPTRIRNRIAKRSPRAANQLTTAITAALDAQTITITAETAWADTIRDLASDLNRINQHRTQLGTDIETAFTEHPLAKVLTSLCGFGPRTGARTLAEIGDPHRFTNGSRLAAYAGLAPVDWQSGSSATTRKPRGGNH